MKEKKHFHLICFSKFYFLAGDFKEQMHIKRVLIHGFKSYNDTVIIGPFTKGCNAVIGLNGSGKSSFYKAIEFVLLDEYTQLNHEVRRALLHESNGETAVSAYVEIVFDNTDRTIPIEKDEVSIRRSISLLKDEYFIDRKHASRQDVRSLLEGCGFSPSSGYYIVRQGNVSSLINMKDSERLDLFLNIAGVKVYENQLEDSLKLIAESDNRSKRILDSLSYIENRLASLEEEKKQYNEWSALDKSRRAIEYCIQQNNLAMNRDEINTLKGQKSNEMQTIEELQTEKNNVSEVINKFNEELSRLRDSEKRFNNEKQAILNEEQKLVKQCERTSLKLRKYENQYNNSSNLRKEKEGELRHILEEIRKLTNKDDNVTEQVNKVNQRRAEVQGQLAVLTTLCDGKKLEDPADVEKELEKTNKQIEKLNQELEALNNLTREAETKVNMLLANKTEIQDKIASQSEALVNIDDENRDLLNKRKELWLKQHQSEKDLILLNRSIDKLKAKCERQVSAEVGIGLDIVSSNSKSEEKIEGIHGAIIDLINVDKDASTAAYVIGKANIYNVIVDDWEVAKELNKLVSRANGKIRSMLLNQVKAPKRNLPSGVDLLINHISYDTNYQEIMDYIFGGVALCKDTSEAVHMVENKNIDCVTIDGDIFRVQGMITTSGSRGVSPLILSSKMAERLSIKKQIESNLEEISQSIKEVKAKLEENESKRIENEATQDQLKEDLSKTTIDIKNARSELDLRKERYLEKLAQVEDTNLYLKSVNERLATIKSINESLDVDTIQLVKDLRNERAELDNHSLHLSQTRTQIRSQLKDFLIPKQRTIENFLTDLEDERIRRKLDHNTKKLNDYNGQLENIRNRASTFQEKFNQILKDISHNEAEAQKHNENLKQISNEISKRKVLLDSLSNRIYIFEKKMNDAVSMDIGSYPADIIDDYKDKRTTDLYRELKAINEELKLYRFVNKKAMEQHLYFNQRREELFERKKELEDNIKSIINLIDALNQKKKDAIERTFAEISDKFSKIFESLVPGASGIISLLKDSETADTPTGISIRVKFDGVEPKSLAQLSGGQKSVVALSLLFAIQQYSPAPFYLLDEVDSALDTEFCESVANLVKSLSDSETETTQSSQFIITSFREELVSVCDTFYALKTDKDHTVGKQVELSAALSIIEENG